MTEYPEYLLHRTTSFSRMPICACAGACIHKHQESPDIKSLHFIRHQLPVRQHQPTTKTEIPSSSSQSTNQISIPDYISGRRKRQDESPCAHPKESRPPTTQSKPRPRSISHSYSQYRNLHGPSISSTSSDRGSSHLASQQDGDVSALWAEGGREALV